MILALETATTACSAALCAADGAVVAERVELEGPAHSQRLLPMVHELLSETGCGWDDIDTVAVGLGPGAFTGLRIGVATARALALADPRLRLAGVATTTALATGMLDALRDLGAAAAVDVLVPLIDGRRREVFAAVFRDTGGPVPAPLEPARAVAVGDLGEWLAARGRVAVGGDGMVRYGDHLPAGVTLLSGVVAPTAAMVGRAVAGGAADVLSGLGEVLPLYGREPDAVPPAWLAGGGRP